MTDLPTFAGLAVFSIPGVLFAIRRLLAPGRGPAGLDRRAGERSPGAVMVTEFRDCPAEELTRAVVIRSDGTGLCDCGATIPAAPLTTTPEEARSDA